MAKVARPLLCKGRDAFAMSVACDCYTAPCNPPNALFRPTAARSCLYRLRVLPILRVALSSRVSYHGSEDDHNYYDTGRSAHVLEISQTYSVEFFGRRTASAITSVPMPPQVAPTTMPAGIEMSKIAWRMPDIAPMATAIASATSINLFQCKIYLLPWQQKPAFVPRGSISVIHRTLAFSAVNVRCWDRRRTSSSPL